MAIASEKIDIRLYLEYFDDETIEVLERNGCPSFCVDFDFDPEDYIDEIDDTMLIDAVEKGGWIVMENDDKEIVEELRIRGIEVLDRDQRLNQNIYELVCDKHGLNYHAPVEEVMELIRKHHMPKQD